MNPAEKEAIFNRLGTPISVTSAAKKVPDCFIPFFSFDTPGVEPILDPPIGLLVGSVDLVLVNIRVDSNPKDGVPSIAPVPG